MVYGLSERRLAELTGDNPENLTLDLSCHQLFAAGRRHVAIRGPFPELEEEIVSRPDFAGYPAWSRGLPQPLTRVVNSEHRELCMQIANGVNRFAPQHVLTTIRNLNFDEGTASFAGVFCLLPRYPQRRRRTMSTASGWYLTAAFSIGLAAFIFAPQVNAGGLDLGGVVGGTVKGALGGSDGGSYSGTSGGHGDKSGGSIGKTGVSVKGKASISGVNAKTKVVLLKKKKLIGAKVLVGKHGSYGKHGKLAVKAVIGTKRVDAKAKVLIGKTAKAKVLASLGGKTKVKGKVEIANISTKVHLGLNIDGIPGGNNGTPPNGSPGTGSTPGAMAGSFRDLSTHDQNLLSRKCSTVLAAPSRFDRDMVALCRIIATL